MHGCRVSRPKLFTTLGAAVLVASFGCQGESPVTVDGVLLLQAKGGGATVPKVDQAIPNWGEQTDTLDVEVTGSGYDDGSDVTFTLDGNPAQIKTISTTYNSSTSLTARIAVEADADLALHDVEVMTARRKKGIGADLFQVVEKGAGQPPGQVEPIPLEVSFLPSMLSETNPRSAPNSANRAEVLLNGNFQVHWSGFGAVTLDLSVPDGPLDLSKVPEWYPVGETGGYISTGFPSVEGGFRAMVPGQSMVTAMHRVWTANNTNWVLHFHGTPPGAPDGCSHDGLSAQDMTVQVEAFNTDTDPDVDKWTLRPLPGAESPATLCGSAAKGKPFSAVVGQFKVPFGFDLLVRLP